MANLLHRPNLILIGITLLLLSTSLNIAIPIVYRESYGDPWVILLAVRIFVLVFTLPLLAFLYRGSSWPRHVFLIVFLVFLARLFMNSITLADFEFYSGAAMISGFAALVCWYAPKSNRWFSNHP